MKSYYILKNHCRYIFLSGPGNFWYEDNAIGDDKSTLYKIYRFILLFIYGFMTILEIMAAVRGEFPSVEKSDSVTFAVSHTIVLIKIFYVIFNKEVIKALNKDMVAVCEKYEEPPLMAAKYRIIKINVVAYFATVYGSAACFVYEGLRKMYEGSHFVTIVTYYPSYEDNSITAISFRIFTTFVLMVMMITMISVDSLTMMYLIMYKYKFITLRHYFEGLRRDFDKVSEAGDRTGATQKLTSGLIEGIVMHEKLLTMNKKIDRAFGLVIAVQVCLSVCSAVSLLLQIALSNDLTFVARLKIIFFVTALFFLLGLFLCNAGEITYQASLISDSIFYCGWHACSAQQPPRRSLGKLVLQACMQAQQPLVMKAFGMLDLTYGTFLLVVRSTYSVFALFYAQRK